METLPSTLYNPPQKKKKKKLYLQRHFQGSLELLECNLQVPTFLSHLLTFQCNLPKMENTRVSHVGGGREHAFYSMNAIQPALKTICQNKCASFHISSDGIPCGSSKRNLFTQYLSWSKCIVRLVPALRHFLWSAWMRRAEVWGCGRVLGGRFKPWLPLISCTVLRKSPYWASVSQLWKWETRFVASGTVQGFSHF